MVPFPPLPEYSMRPKQRLEALRTQAGLSPEDYQIHDHLSGVAMSRQGAFPYLSTWSSGRIFVTLTRDSLTQEFPTVEEAAVYLHGHLHA